MTHRPHHFVVDGQFRDYNCAEFCDQHYSEAIECAQEWIEEAADGRDIGEQATVTVEVKPGDCEYGCVVCHDILGWSKPAPEAT